MENLESQTHGQQAERLNELREKMGCIDSAGVVWQFAPSTDTGKLDAVGVVIDGISYDVERDEGWHGIRCRLRRNAEAGWTELFLNDKVRYAAKAADALLENRLNENKESTAEQNLESEMQGRHAKRLNELRKMGYIDGDGIAWEFASFPETILEPVRVAVYGVIYDVARDEGWLGWCRLRRSADTGWTGLYLSDKVREAAKAADALFLDWLSEIKEAHAELPPTHITRTISVMVCPHNNRATFGDMATKITIDDEAAGEYLRISQSHDEANPGEILIDPKEWPHLRAAIDQMMEQIQEHKQDDHNN
jgi:hypothetical protein